MIQCPECHLFGQVALISFAEDARGRHLLLREINESFMTYSDQKYADLK